MYVSQKARVNHELFNIEWGEYDPDENRIVGCGPDEGGGCYQEVDVRMTGENHAGEIMHQTWEILIRNMPHNSLSHRVEVCGVFMEPDEIMLVAEAMALAWFLHTIS